MDISSRDLKLVAQCCKIRRTRRRRIILALTIAVGLDARGKVTAKASGTIVTFPRSAMVVASCAVSGEDIVSWLRQEQTGS